MNGIKQYIEKMFEDIKHIDENGCEFWYARGLMPLLLNIFLISGKQMC